MRTLFGKFNRDRRGSGIVTVLIAVFLVLMLGATVLYMSYTGFLIQAGERRSEQNFYDAETVMDEIRTGLQTAVSDSITAAYHGVLENYSTLLRTYASSTAADKPATLDEYMQQQFQTRYLAALFAWKTGAAGTDPALLTPANAADPKSGGTYSIDALTSFVLAAHRSGVTITGGSYVLKDGTLTLKGLQVTVKRGGYETNISTDVELVTPPFSYTASEYSLSNFNKLSLVARETLSSDIGGAELKGNVYAGSVSLQTLGTSLTYSGGTFVCAGDLSVKNSYTAGNAAAYSFVMTGADGDEFWAGGVTLDDYGGVRLAGAVNIKDDLTLNGKGASVILGSSGTGDSYTGFGYLNAVDSAPAGSSSIIVNGRSTSLNMSALETLTLAGNSFIQKDSTANYAMGQSIATRSDQLAYLVPASVVTAATGSRYLTNPAILNDTTAQIDTYADAVRAKLTELGGVSETAYFQYVDGVQPVYANLSSAAGVQIVYFFLTFDTVEHANSFFTGYFSENSTNISNYLTSYLSSYSPAAVTLSRGDAYGQSNGVLTLNGAQEDKLDSAGVSSWAAETKPYTVSFTNLCHTMTETIADDAVDDPYAYLVNSTAVNALFSDSAALVSLKAAGLYSDSGKVLSFTADGTAVSAANPALAKIVYGDYAIAAGETAKVILCTGKVTVSAAFNGVILAGTDIDLQASVSAAGTSSAALQAKITLPDGQTKTVLDYLNIGSGTGTEENGGAGSTWNMDELVTYQNWKKF